MSQGNMLVAFDPFEHKPFRTKRMELLPFAITAGAEGNTSFCGCGDKSASFVVYSDDHGVTWSGGALMQLLPQYGGGWTEDQVAELRNGSVLMTSRNFYGGSSGQGPRLFARSDDGGATWAANWSFFEDKLPGGYCEGSIISDADGAVYFGHPGMLHSGARANYTVHKSLDGGRTWPHATVVYPGGSAYSDMALLRNGSIGVFFEKDNYNTLSFATIGR